MKANLHPSYTEVMEKDPIFLWPISNRRSLKDFGEIELNIPEQEFIGDSKHQCKALHKPIFPLQVIPINRT